MTVTRRYFFEYLTCKCRGEVLERKYRKESFVLLQNRGKILKEL